MLFNYSLIIGTSYTRSFCDTERARIKIRINALNSVEHITVDVYLVHVFILLTIYAISRIHHIAAEYPTLPRTHKTSYVQVVHNSGVGDICQLFGVDEVHVVLQTVDQKDHPAVIVTRRLGSEWHNCRPVGVRKRHVLADER